MAAVYSAFMDSISASFSSSLCCRQRICSSDDTCDGLESFVTAVLPVVSLLLVLKREKDFPLRLKINGALKLNRLLLLDIGDPSLEERDSSDFLEHPSS
mmetsp:Transcript_8465/g.20333  ORF Transcript_8465/g.20333 Transcript_8465/m.20333 type:complete len:99 (-) Transcript_8465:1591-1887(-)